MLNSTTIDFLRQLKANNTKEWFYAHQDIYKAARADIIQLASKLLIAVQAFDDSVGLRFLEPSKCITRINRNLRFSRDKTPYKTDYYIIINKDGKSSESAFYYLHIEIDGCNMGGGVYTPEPPTLQKIREDIDYAPAEWLALVEDEGFKKAFPRGLECSGQLMRVPAAYNSEHKAAKLLKMKDFYTMAQFDASFITSPDAVAQIAERWRASEPLVALINRALSFEG